MRNPLYRWIIERRILAGGGRNSPSIWKRKLAGNSRHRRLGIEACESRCLCAADVSLWNAANQWDANADSVVTVGDLLPIVTALRDHGVAARNEFPDVNCDGAVSIADLLAEVGLLRSLGNDPFDVLDNAVPPGTQVAEGEGGLPTVSAGGAAVAFEGDLLTFDVVVTLPQGQDEIEEEIVINYSTSHGSGAGAAQDGGAGEDDDFSYTASFLTFTVGGPLVLQVTVNTNEDSDVEGDEVFSFWIAQQATNANVGQREAIGTIWDDDIEVPVVGDLVMENGGTVQPKYWVNAGSALGHTDPQTNQPCELVLVGSTTDYSAEAPGDYAAVFGHETDVNGQASQGNPFPLATITVQDDFVEEDLFKTFGYYISVDDDTSDVLDVHILDSNAILTIQDND